MQEVWIDDFQLHGPGNTSFWVSSISGLDAPDFDLSTFNNPGEDGGSIPGGSYGFRHPQIIGVVSADNVAQYEANRQALSKATALIRDSYGVPIQRRVRFKTVAGVWYSFFGVVKDPKFPYDQMLWAPYSIQIEAPLPHIFTGSAVNSGSIMLPKATGVTWPVKWPLTFGGLTGGQWSVNNPGTLYSWPIIRLDGPLHTPTIINTLTNSIIQLDTFIEAGSYVYIYMGTTFDSLGVRQVGKRILRNGTDSLVESMTNDSDWWAIEPGQQVISFSSSDTSDNGTMSLEFLPAVVGF